MLNQTIFEESQQVYQFSQLQPQPFPLPLPQQQLQQQPYPMQWIPQLYYPNPYVPYNYGSQDSDMSSGPLFPIPYPQMNHLNPMPQFGYELPRIKSLEEYENSTQMIGEPLALNQHNQSYSLTPMDQAHQMQNTMIISYPRLMLVGPGSATSSPVQQSNSAEPTTVIASPYISDSPLIDSKSKTKRVLPGPIKATKPILSYDDATGEEVLKFRYTDFKIVKEFALRIPRENCINCSEITEDFKKRNCLYPNAMVPVDQYQGRRYKYENECNEVGWIISWYNKDIRGRKGILQRAVDSWRNTRNDKRVRSRRVRGVSK
ncbi:hypothetical protein WICPIJ_009385 [Wickerhamomyces pijperi]|uniref:DUF8032 domain-containing protein n=1 Tax=Wickerhamomyces pijperi TaxID=599730 RepID=A0A9P8PPK4_WICPI|nr:hypothetical protein WICPIJ_009385 [Wickerhamomyces pijperi]